MYKKPQVRPFLTLGLVTAMLLGGGTVVADHGGNQGPDPDDEDSQTRCAYLEGGPGRTMMIVCAHAYVDALFSGTTTSMMSAHGAGWSDHFSGFATATHTEQGDARECSWIHEPQGGCTAKFGGRHYTGSSASIGTTACVLIDDPAVFLDILDMGLSAGATILLDPIEKVPRVCVEAAAVRAL